jgi:hypothetical protein
MFMTRILGFTHFRELEKTASERRIGPDVRANSGLSRRLAEYALP